MEVRSAKLGSHLQVWEKGPFSNFLDPCRPKELNLFI
jgi:hypothetical protein